MTNKKKLGWGSLALFFAVLAIIWCSNVQFWDGFCLGDYVLRLLGVPRWSNGADGIHYTVFYGLIFLVPAWLIGRKRSEDRFAILGSRIAGILTVVVILSPMFIVV